MKKITSCLLILTFFVSCSDDLKTHQEVDNDTIVHKDLNEALPLKTINPYDDFGALHDELFETYYASGNLPTSISGIISRVETIADANNGFISIKDSNYSPVTSQSLQYILEHKSSCVADIILVSSMSSGAKLSLTNFINSLVLFFPTELSGDALSDFVIKYENSVIANSLFTSIDKKIILTTTSIARHSVCKARKKPKKNTDPDWLIFVGNIIAATEGAENGCAKAVTAALATGIAQN